MLLRTKKSLISLLVIICAVLFAAIVTALTQSVGKAYAYTTEQLEGAAVIDIYNKDTKKFTEKALNNLAVNAGYSNLNGMISAATAEGAALSPKFTDTVVQLGVDRTAGGSDLKWVPVYLSRSADGDAVLTLWLATDIYKSTWSDGTSSRNAAKTFNGNSIYSNTYDGSFIRHKLNGKTGWTTSWGAGSNQNSANKNIGTMVSDFYGSGELASYIVAPSNISWQTGTGSNRMKNDPDWAGNASLTAYYPCDWVNDNVWLPSMYEVFDKDITADSVAVSFTGDGGLWGVKVGNICSANSKYSWLRSGDHTNTNYAYCLYSSGNFNTDNITTSYGVRPALHINLNSAAQNMELDHVHAWESADNDGWVVTVPATCVSKGMEERICSAADCPLTDSKETKEIDIDATAHSFDATTWKSDATHHWHECAACGAKDTLVAHTVGAAATCTQKAVCEHCSAEYGDLGDHSWNDGEVTKQPTCSATGVKTYTCMHNSEHTKTEDIAVDANAHSFATAWISDESGHWHAATCEHASERSDFAAHTAGDWIVDTAAQIGVVGSKHKECTVCGYTTETAEIPALPVPHAHTFATEWSKDESGHWHAATCEHTSERSDFAAHTAGDWIVDTVAQIGVVGSKHKECTVCGCTTESVTVPALKEELVKPDENGGENQVVVTTPNGFTPDMQLVVTEIEKENYDAYQTIAETVNGEINLIYDVTLKSGGVTIQPDGMLTIKLLMPTDLRGKNFKLFHLHGEEATETEYEVDGNYAVVTSDKLSEFIFVGEKTAVTPAPNGGNGLSAGAIAGITIAAIIAVLLAVYIALYFTLYRKGVLKGKACDIIYAPMNAIFKKKEQA